MKFKHQLILVGSIAGLVAISIIAYYKYIHTAIRPPVYHKDLSWNEVAHNPNSFIMHAGGAIDSIKYTNSREAVLQSISNGSKMIELDLAITSDNYIVAVHDWKHFRSIAGLVPKDEPMSLEEFRKQKIHDKYTPLTYIEIEEIFSNNPNLILVTDKISDYKIIVDNFSFIDRIYVEVFGMKDYQKALKAGIKYPMFSLSSHKHIDLVRQANIPLIVMHSKFMMEFEKEIQNLFDSGVCIYVYSSNDENFFKKYISHTITGVYTDFWVINKGNSSEKNGKTY